MSTKGSSGLKCHSLDSGLTIHFGIPNNFTTISSESKEDHCISHCLNLKFTVVHQESGYDCSWSASLWKVARPVKVPRQIAHRDLPQRQPNGPRVGHWGKIGEWFFFLFFDDFECWRTQHSTSRENPWNQIQVLRLASHPSPKKSLNLQQSNQSRTTCQATVGTSFI